MNNDPVLNRPMFNNSLAPTVQPMQAYGTGITSNVVSPDEGAKQLINTFGGSGMAGMSVPGYAGGGSVRHFYEGDVVDAGETDADAAARRTLDSRLKALGESQSRDPRSQGNLEADRQERKRQVEVRPDRSSSTYLPPSRAEEERLNQTPPPAEGVLNIPNRDGISVSGLVGAARDAILPPGVIPAGSSPPKADGANYYEGMAGVDRRAPISSRTGNEEYGQPMPSPEAPAKKGEEQGPPMPPRASEREKRSGKGGLDLLLEDIKNRRAASAEEKENNKWMALMQAGLAIMGGRSRHALQNIGTGGQQGAQAYAASEKDRRAEDRALFGEEAQVRLAQEKMAESADERAAQREVLTAKEKERLHERALTRESQAHDRGIAALNTAAGQTRQELNDISNQLSRLDGEIRRYELTVATDPEVSKAAIARLNQEKQAYADRAAEVRSRQDELLGLQGRKVPERNQDFSGFRMLGGAPKQ